MSIKIHSELVRMEPNPFANLPEIKQLIAKHPDPYSIWILFKDAIYFASKPKNAAVLKSETCYILLETVEYILIPWMKGDDAFLENICNGFDQLSDLSNFTESLHALILAVAEDISSSIASPDSYREKANALDFCFEMAAILTKHSPMSEWNKN